MLKRVHHIGIAVTDLDKAKELLADKLGLEVVRDHRSADGGISAAFLRCGEVEIELLELHRPEERAAWLHGQPLGRIEHIAIEVDGALETALQALGALGIEADPPRPGPFGNTVRTHPETTTGIVLQLLSEQG